jgi:hypothetical protein
MIGERGADHASFPAEGQAILPASATANPAHVPDPETMILSGRAWTRVVTAIHETIEEYERDRRPGWEAYVAGLRFGLARIEQNSEVWHG